MIRVIAAIALVLMMAACQHGSVTVTGTGGDTGGLTACESAMKLAAVVDETEDALTDLDPAIQQCESLDEFERAVRKFPAALDGVSPRFFLTYRCDQTPSVALETVCHEATQQ